MIEYYLADADGNTFALNADSSGNERIFRGSLTYLNDSFEIEHRIREKTAGAGSVALGLPRLKSRNVSFDYQRGETDLRVEENEIMSFLPKVVYIVDNTNRMRIKARALTKTIDYLNGSHKTYGAGSIVFTLLDPFWEMIDYEEETLSVTGGTQGSMSFTVGGYYDIAPYIEIEAASACASLEIFVNDTDPDKKVGIKIQDPLFGTSGYETLVIDNTQGIVYIGDLDRAIYIDEGTGFFTVPFGAQEIIFNPSANVDVTLQYRPRYFI